MSEYLGLQSSSTSKMRTANRAPLQPCLQECWLLKVLGDATVTPHIPAACGEHTQSAAHTLEPSYTSNLIVCFITDLSTGEAAFQV